MNSLLTIRLYTRVVVSSSHLSHRSVTVPLLLVALVISQLLCFVAATDIKKDDAATAESSDEVIRY